MGTVRSLDEARHKRRRSVRLTAVFSTLAAKRPRCWCPALNPSVSNRCDIEELEVAGESATVIAIPDEHGRETALIWSDHPRPINGKPVKSAPRHSVSATPRPALSGSIRKRSAALAPFAVAALLGLALTPAAYAQGSAPRRGLKPAAAKAGSLTTPKRPLAALVCTIHVVHEGSAFDHAA